VLIGPWTHNYPENGWPLPRINDRYECLRWFDKYLKERDTDPDHPLENEPPVTLFVREFTRPEVLRRRDEGHFHHETHWPPVRTKQLHLYLGKQGRLTPGGAEAHTPLVTPGRSALLYRPDVGVAAGRYVIGQMLPGWGMPEDQRLDEPFSLVYTTDPLSADFHGDLTGVPEARLHLSCTAAVAFVSVKLCDMARDGTSVLVSKGVLNLTHRNSHETPEPLEPGRIYEIRVPLLAAAYHFRPGHRLRLMLAAADFQNAWPSPLPHTLTVHYGPHHPSQIVLPMVSRSGPPLPAPRFLPSDFPPLPPEQIPTPQYAITRDLIRQTATVSYTTRSGIGVNRSNYTISLNRPAEAMITSEFEYPLERPGLSILVRSQCITRSDAAAFHHLTHVEITMNGRKHWSKNWSVSVPRDGC
jgi:hypothetical protein